MAAVLGVPSPQHKACPRCGERYPTFFEASVCCLFAPDPNGWCAWCGEDLEGKRVFCGHPCAVSFERDL